MRRACFTLRAARFLCLTVLWVTRPPCGAFPMPDTSGAGLIPLVPEVGYLGPMQTLTLWQIPKGQTRKVLLILEGRNTVPYDWWDHSPCCHLCRGLPENRRIVMEALSNYYAVVVPHSLVPDGDWGDWPQDSPDLVNILSILLEWKLSKGLENVPTIALGVSAGGRCLAALALQPGLFESMVHMISPGRPEIWRAATHDYPPTLFIHMPKDIAKAVEITAARKLLVTSGVPTGEVTWYEHALTPDWFSRSIIGLNLATSKAIFNLLKANKSLVQEDNFLKTDDFLGVWDAMAMTLPILPPDQDNSGQPMFVDAVWQEIKVAYAFHVTIATKNREMFAWFDGAYSDQEARPIFVVNNDRNLE